MLILVVMMIMMMTIVMMMLVMLGRFITCLRQPSRGAPSHPEPTHHL